MRRSNPRGTQKMVCMIETKTSRGGKWRPLTHFRPSDYAACKAMVDDLEEYGNGPFRIVDLETGAILCTPKPV
jgi:hypothetical protein